VISILTTEFNSAHAADRAFESNMFSRTNAFGLFGERGRIKVETAALGAGGLRVSRVRSTGHFVDLDEETAVTILLPSSGQLRVRIAAAEYRVAAKSVCVFGPGMRRTRAERPADGDLFHSNALMIPQLALHDLVRAAGDGGSRPAGMPDALPIAARLPEVRRLSDLLGYITRQFDDGLPVSSKAAAAMSALLEDILVAMIQSSTEGQQDTKILPAAWIRVRMAEELMRARSDEPLSMSEVAREVGVGLRSLQLAFLEIRAMGPRDVLLQMRLNRARERLRVAAPGETVTSIALDCGFAHLGRFPAAYRTAFGELPTETLARSRRRLV
jgi:AraC-like DNA-binding protein